MEQVLLASLIEEATTLTGMSEEAARAVVHRLTAQGVACMLEDVVLELAEEKIRAAKEGHKEA